MNNNFVFLTENPENIYNATWYIVMVIFLIILISNENFHKKTEIHKISVLNHYIGFLPSKALIKVISSAYSISAPTGKP